MSIPLRGYNCVFTGEQIWESEACSEREEADGASLRKT